MDQMQIMERIEMLEQHIQKQQNAYKAAHNTSVVYDTKSNFGYSQLVEIQGGKVIYLSGMTPWNKEMKLEADNLLDQLEHTMSNLTALLKSKEMTLDHLVSLRFYVAKPNYYDEMEAITTTVSKHFGKKEVTCAMTLIGVTGLAEPDQLIEIEAIAIQ